tara:strand:+ start:1156 stop:1746 length:591 start_codon:yes stop_codon:yes gene_type:complete
MSNILCSNCENNDNLTPPGSLSSVFCLKCGTVTDIKTGKKIFKSYPHPTNPYNYSEDELFLVLCFGSMVVTAAGKPEHLDKVYKWLKGENDDFFDGGIGLDDEKFQKIHNRLIDGNDKAIEIAKNLSLDEQSNLFNVLYLMLINQNDRTIEEAAALVKICNISESNWHSFFIYVCENSPYEIKDLGPIMTNIKLPL